MMKTKKNKSKFNKQSINTTNPTRTTINSKNQTKHQNLETKILSINKKTTANKENKKPWQKSDLLKPKNSYKHPKTSNQAQICHKNQKLYNSYGLLSPITKKKQSKTLPSLNRKLQLKTGNQTNHRLDLYLKITDWIYT